MGDPEAPEETRELSAYALISWEEAKQVFDLADTDQDFVTFLINSISLRVKEITGRILVEAEHSEYLRGFGDKTILLPQFPVSEITVLKLDPSRAFGDDTALETAEYCFDAASGIIELYERVTSRGQKTIYCEWTAGFNPVPEHIQEAVLETIQWNLGRFKGGGIGMEMQSAEGVMVRPSLTIPPSAWAVFMELRRPC